MNVKLNIIFICSFILLFSCKQKEDEYHNITDKIEDLSKDFKGIPMSSDKYTETLKKVEVTENWQRFYIPERKSQIKSFECSECHSKPLHEIQGEENIRIRHPMHIINLAPVRFNSRHGDDGEYYPEDG